MAKQLTKTKRSSQAKGATFENICKDFLKPLFERLGFQVIECRPQRSGTQNGFDIQLTFLDDLDRPREFYFECKDYQVDLDHGELLKKILEVDASNHQVDAFIVLSPHVEISNIQANINAGLKNKFKFPIRYWTPASGIGDYFATDSTAYNSVYKKAPHGINELSIYHKLKIIIKNILSEKDSCDFAKKILITNAQRNPKEADGLKTTLDQKLNALISEDDPNRIAYHQQRCDYKVYLEDLQDTNNELRQDLIRWQNDMRVKADRLTKQFTTDPNYTASQFFFEFFKIAETDMLRFLSEEKITGDKQKLLHGIIFELAAECPLNWKQ